MSSINEGSIILILYDLCIPTGGARALQIGKGLARIKELVLISKSPNKVVALSHFKVPSVTRVVAKIFTKLFIFPGAVIYRLFTGA